MGQDAPRPCLKPFVFDQIKALAKRLVADSQVLSPERLASFAAAFAAAASGAQHRLIRVGGAPLFLRSTICRARISEHLCDTEIGALSGACHECWSSLHGLRLTHLAFVARGAALVAWPAMSPISCAPLIEAFCTARPDDFGMNPMKYTPLSASHTSNNLMVLCKLVGAIAWAACAPDRSWFAHWLVEMMHESEYSDEARKSAGHRFESFLHRSLGFASLELDVGDDEFGPLFYQGYHDLEIQMQKLVRARALAIFKRPL